ncbi:hypothetical protein QQF64_019387 [Cirrhinus molitorella]|uniref:Uncharacterized protein n=1 Tax=Cirrhinus molitorella TaxID=172907 RepID=A0ABR3LHR4_9TELE
MGVALQPLIMIVLSYNSKKTWFNRSCSLRKYSISTKRAKEGEEAMPTTVLLLLSAVLFAGTVEAKPYNIQICLPIKWTLPS